MYAGAPFISIYGGEYVQKRRRKRGKRPLSEIQLYAIELLAITRGANYEDIAKELGISVRTLYRWRQRKDFEAALKVAVKRYITSLRIKPTFAGILKDRAYIVTVCMDYFAYTK